MQLPTSVFDVVVVVVVVVAVVVVSVVVVAGVVSPQPCSKRAPGAVSATANAAK